VQKENPDAEYSDAIPRYRQHYWKEIDRENERREAAGKLTLTNEDLVQALSQAILDRNRRK